MGIALHENQLQATTLRVNTLQVINWILSTLKNNL